MKSYKEFLHEGSLHEANEGDRFVHKHSPEIEIELVEPTNKGWKVKQFEKRGGKVKSKTAYFDRQDIVGSRALFEPINESLVNEGLLNEAHYIAVANLGTKKSKENLDSFDELQKFMDKMKRRKAISVQVTKINNGKKQTIDYDWDGRNWVSKNKSGIRSIGTMSEDEWKKTEARFAENINEGSSYHVSAESDSIRALLKVPNVSRSDIRTTVDYSGQFPKKNYSVRIDSFNQQQVGTGAQSMAHDLTKSLPKIPRVRYVVDTSG